jgi:phosphoglycolate phosphatase
MSFDLVIFDLDGTLVAALLATQPFDVVRGARPDVPLKPDPMTALDIAAGLSTRPGRTLCVGDTDTDMRTGRRAGMVTVGVTWGFRDEDELRSSGARHIIHHPIELLEILNAAD